MTATKNGEEVEVTPIFCTVDIEPEDFKESRDPERREHADIAKITIPVSPFGSSAIGKTADEVREIYNSIYSLRPFTEATLIIMDERTEKDRNTCLLVSVGVEEETARCVFGLAAEILCGPESCTKALNEGVNLEKARDPEDENGIFYTEETWPMTPEKWIDLRS